ncbi:hypothetical protein [Bosea sp. PAMC 26642]|uniref:hypothetical protein n=1 Tax=Bosea sp. (strain PAMC 26642) TaxID=1792307 RepID=UPI0014386E6C|nr:hypothetical protein [Bosea sp. PAMC 26642]
MNSAMLPAGCFRRGDGLIVGRGIGVLSDRDDWSCMSVDPDLSVVSGITQSAWKSGHCVAHFFCRSRWRRSCCEIAALLHRDDMCVLVASLLELLKFWNATATPLCQQLWGRLMELIGKALACDQTIEAAVPVAEECAIFDFEGSSSG